MADTPAPRPPTADPDVLDVYDETYEQGYATPMEDDLAAEIRRLRAEVGRLTADLATTTSLLHKLFDRYDLGADGEPAERYEARAAQPEDNT